MFQAFHIRKLEEIKIRMTALRHSRITILLSGGDIMKGFSSDSLTSIHNNKSNDRFIY